MVNHNPETKVRVKKLVAAASHTAGATPSVIDTKGYREALVIIDAGTFTGDESVTLTMQEDDAADGLTKTAITGAAFAAITTANDETIFVGRVSLNPAGATRKRYLTCSITQTGTGTAPYSAVVVLFNPEDTALQASAVGGNSYSFAIA
jgi:hypothetical protein